jgi:hypothetical protein
LEQQLVQRKKTRREGKLWDREVVGVHWMNGLLWGEREMLWWLLLLIPWIDVLRFVVIIRRWHMLFLSSLSLSVCLYLSFLMLWFVFFFCSWSFL